MHLWLMVYGIIKLVMLMAVAGASAGTPSTDTSNTTSYATASWTPTASRLILVAVCNASGTDALVPTSVTGNGLTYTLVATSQRADLQRRVSVYRAYNTGSATAGAITVTFSASQQGCLIHISQYTGTGGSGDNGASAMGSTPATPNWASTSNPSMTLAFDDATNSATYGAFSHGAAMTAGSGFTQLADTSHINPTSEMMTEFQASVDTTVDVTAGSGQGCGVALELKVPAAAPTFPPPKPTIVGQAVTRAATW